MNIRLLFALALLVVSCKGCEAKCPDDCLCDLDNLGRKMVRCNSGALAAIPVNGIDADAEVLLVGAPEHRPNNLTIGPIFRELPNLSEVRITRSNIPAIGAYSFYGLSHLHTLNLSNNAISSLTSRNLHGITNLRNLHLDNNLVESMHSGVFSSLIRLRVLTLARNNIAKLAPRIFLGLSALQVLDLSYNNLRELDVDVFKDIRDVREFRCRNCSIVTMNPYFYSILSSLTNLDLADNQLQYIAVDAFHELRLLQYLNLEGNLFSVILDNTFGAQQSLKYLNLAWNKLAKIDDYAFLNVTCLAYLDISYNKLDRLEPVIFRPISSSLRNLRASGNRLKSADIKSVLKVISRIKALSLGDLAFSDMPLGIFQHSENLLYLNLSGNSLKSVPYLVFEPLRKLIELDVSNNQFQGLDERTLNALESAHTIHTERNPWNCDLCYIGPLLNRTTRKRYAGNVRCEQPENLKGRLLSTIHVASLDWCRKATLKNKGGGVVSYWLTKQSGIGLIVVAVGVVVCLSVAIIGAMIWVLNTRHYAYYYTNEEKRSQREKGAAILVFHSNGSADKRENKCRRSKNRRASIATIDEINKDPDLQILSNGDALPNGDTYC